MQCAITKICFLILLPFLSLSLTSCGRHSSDNNTTTPTYWKLHPNNPIISYGDEISNLIWNDPIVIKEGSTYKMWLSGGTGIGTNNVKIYQATSQDGINWNISSNILIEPGTSGSWDDEKTETPSVIKVGNIYHMYYSGFKTGNPSGAYQIGHATSADGISWTKDPSNPIITYHNDLQNWGYYHSAEPSAVHNQENNKIYLYYMTSKIRSGYTGPNTNLNSQHGICVATSADTDGSNFNNIGSSNRVVVLTQSQNYPVEKDYRGYTTPFVYIDENTLFHMYYSAVKHPSSENWEMVSLAHASSLDGLSFTEINHEILVTSNESWTHKEVRAPSLLSDNNILKLWYAGHTDWFNNSGIGYAEYK